MLDREKKKIEKQYNFEKTTAKEREVKLNKQLTACSKENNDAKEEIINLSKTCK